VLVPPRKACFSTRTTDAPARAAAIAAGDPADPEPTTTTSAEASRGRRSRRDIRPPGRPGSPTSAVDRQDLARHMAGFVGQQVDTPRGRPRRGQEATGQRLLAAGEDARSRVGGRRADIGVATSAGARALTRMPCGAYAAAIVLASVAMAPFAAA